MIDDIHAAFEACADEYLCFERIENPRSKRPDIHAFLLLDELVPDTGNIISGADHDIYYLDVDVDTLCGVITQEQIVELRRCGISYDPDYDCLYSFT